MVDPFQAQTALDPRSLCEAALARLRVPPKALPPDILGALEARARFPDRRLVIGRYLVLGELGRGGMGLVYEAWDPGIERRVAIKTIEPETVPEDEREEVVERFRREIRVVGRLHHPGVVTIYDYGEERDGHRSSIEPYAKLYYYVMEYLEGESLARVLRERSILPDVEAVTIVAEVLEALDVAHRAGVIHRDVKPSNVFLRHGREAVLLDFGIAKTGSMALTRQGQILGTPSYLAPERLREKEVAVDGRADIFSLGVLLFTMLTGKAPFVGDDVYDVIDKIASESHPTLARSTPSGRALSRVLDRMLAKRPEDRYPTAGDAAVALRHVLALLKAAHPDTDDLSASAVLIREALDEAFETEIATPSAVSPAAPDEVDTGRHEIDAFHRTPRVEVSSSAHVESVRGAGEVEPALMPKSAAEILATLPELPLRDTLEVESRARSASPPTPPPMSETSEPAAEAATPPPRVTHRSDTQDADEGVAYEPHSAKNDEITDDRTLTDPPADRTSVQPAKAKQRVRRSRIEASLVDEEDVVVKPTPLDAHSEEIPTQSGAKASAHSPPMPLPSAHPIPETTGPSEGSEVGRVDTEAGVPDPAELIQDPSAEDTPSKPIEGFERAELDLEEAADAPSEVDAPRSAAVARRTFAAQRGVAARGGKAGAGSGHIRISGSVSLGADRSRLVRRRGFMLVVAMLAAIAVGLFLGRLKQRSSAVDGGRVSEGGAKPLASPRASKASPSGAGAHGEDSARSATELLKEAGIALTEGNPKQAEQLFQSAADAAPPGSLLRGRAVLGRADALIKLGKRDEAITLYRGVLGELPESEAATEARVALRELGVEADVPRGASARGVQGRRSDSRDRTPEIVDLEAPGLASPNRSLEGLSSKEKCEAIASRHLNDPVEAIAALTRLGRDDPGSWCVYWQLGIFHGKRNDDRGALSAYRRYLELRPDAPNRVAVERRVRDLEIKLEGR